MNVLEVLKNQTTCREYSDKKIEKEKILEIIEASKQSPSWKNGQAYHIIVTDGVVKDKICDLFDGKNLHIKSSSYFLIFVADFSKVKKIFDYEEKEIAGFDIYETLVATTDAAIVAQTANIAAQSMGIETCYIGLIRNVEKEVKEILNLPKHSYIVFGLTLGYPSDSYEKRVKPRLEDSVNVSWNTYESNTKKEVFDDYNKKMDNFNKGIGYKWSDVSIHSYIKESKADLKNFLYEQQLLKK